MKQKTLYQRKTNKIKDIFDNIKQSHIIMNKITSLLMILILT